MKIVLDGKIASGKTYLASLIAKHYQLAHIDLDQEVKALYKNQVIQEEVVKLLDLETFSIDQIRDIIINDITKRKMLEDYLYQILKNQINTDDCVIDGYNSFKIVDDADVYLYISADKDIRYKRYLQRDGIDYFKAINYIQPDLVLMPQWCFGVDNSKDGFKQAIDIIDKRNAYEK